jgi:hypothetical protein
MVNFMDGGMYNFWHKDGLVRTSQNAKPVVEFAKFQREAQGGKGRKMGDWHHLMRIPTAKIEQYINEGKLKSNCLQDPEQLAKLQLLIKKECPAFVCTDKKF